MSTRVSATDWKNQSETVSQPMLSNQDDDSSEMKSHADATTRPGPFQAPISHYRAAGNFKKRRVDASAIVADSLGVLTTLAFLIFGAMVIRLNHRGTGTEQPHYLNAITTLATIFPIVFAAILGRLVTQITHWRLEKGAKLGLLEQLMGSRTVGASVISIIQLQRFNLVCLAIVLAWAFSPFGSQAILRMLHARLVPLAEPTLVTYYDTDSRSALSDQYPRSPNHAGQIDRRRVNLDLMYGAVILTSDSAKANSMDNWGNVKIPYLDSYGDPLDTHWKTVPDSNQHQFSSLVGIPVSGISPGNTTFSLESNYVHLECHNITRESVTVDDGVATFPEIIDLANSSLCLGPGYGCGDPVANGTWQGHTFTGQSARSSWFLAMDRFVDPLWSNQTLFPDRNVEGTEYPGQLANETGIRAEESTLLFQARLTTSTTTSAPEIVKAYCGATQRYVESQVHCERRSGAEPQSCAVVAQRRSTKPRAPESISQLSFPSIFRAISGRLPIAMDSTSLRPDVSLYYLVDPSIDSIFELSEKPELEGVPLRDFGFRLGQLINSYILLGQENLTSIVSGSVEEGVVLEPNITMASDVKTLVEKYVIDGRWAALYMVSCAVLLAAAVWSAVLTHLVHVPDVLGYASTVIRDSKFMDLDPDAGRLDGLALTRRMADQELRYGVTQATMRGTPLVGVGPTTEVEPVKPS